MARLGVMKRSELAFNTRGADLVNLAGGSAYSVANPSEKLLHIVGSPGFNEPNSYYHIPDNPELARKFSGSLKSLTGQAKLIIDAAIDVARSDNPRDLLAIAHWLRIEGYCRQTPLVLLAVAASETATRKFVRQYAPKIIKRADELAGAFAAYRYLFGKPIPAALLKGIRDSWGNFDEYQLIKYNRNQNPSLKDVLLQMPNRKEGRPVSRGVAEYLINGALVDKNGRDFSSEAPLISSYIEFVKAATEQKKLTPEVAHLADKAHITWEVMISTLGSSKETWTHVLPHMGYMALMRNLRNMLQNDVDSDRIASIISDKNKVLKSKQFPFRFQTAIKELQSLQINYVDRNKLLNALSKALDFSVENVGRVEGATAVLVDCSGSMLHAPLSRHSSVNMKEAAACLAGIFAKACDSAFIFPFAEHTRLLDFVSNDSVTTIIDKILTSNVGMATYAYKPIKFATQHGIKVDRIVILSDMQCYHDRAQNLQEVVAEYRRKINSSVWIHSINMNAHDFSAQIDSGQNNTNLISGFSDKVLKTILETEMGGSKGSSIEYIRANF